MSMHLEERFLNMHSVPDMFMFSAVGLFVCSKVIISAARMIAIIHVFSTLTAQNMHQRIVKLDPLFQICML